MGASASSGLVKRGGGRSFYSADMVPRKTLLHVNFQKRHLRHFFAWELRSVLWGWGTTVGLPNLNSFSERFLLISRVEQSARFGSVRLNVSKLRLFIHWFKMFSSQLRKFYHFRFLWLVVFSTEQHSMAHLSTFRFAFTRSAHSSHQPGWWAANLMHAVWHKWMEIARWSCPDLGAATVL